MRLLVRLLVLLSLVLPPLACRAQLNVETAIDMGRSALYYEDYVTAIDRFNDVLLVRPRKAEVYYYRGYAKFSLEDYNGAAADCSEAIRLNPFRVEFYQLRGLTRINLSDYAAAIADYSRVLQELPDEQNSRYNRALCHLELKDYDAARTDLDYTITHWPRFARAYLVSAQIALETADTLGAIHWTDSLLAILPRDREALGFRGRLCLWEDNSQRADSFLTAAIDLGGASLDNYLCRAQARHNLNRFNASLADYDAVIARAPQHFVAHYNRGLLRALVGADNLAIEDFDFVLSLEPDNTLALYNRAILREQTGNFRGAEADYTSLLRLYPQFYAGYQARSRCRRKLGKNALALQDETRAARADYDLVFGNHRRTPIKRVRRRSDHELDRYQDLMEVEPDTMRIFVSDVAGRVQNRQTEHNLLPAFPTDDINRVLAEDPTNAIANAQLRYNSGCMHADIGLNDTAIEDFAEAIQLNPRLGQAWYNRAILLVREGRKTEAAADLSHAGELGIYQAYNLLKQIKSQPSAPSSKENSTER